MSVSKTCLLLPIFTLLFACSKSEKSLENVNPQLSPKDNSTATQLDKINPETFSKNSTIEELSKQIAANKDQISKLGLDLQKANSTIKENSDISAAALIEQKKDTEKQIKDSENRIAEIQSQLTSTTNDANKTKETLVSELNALKDKVLVLTATTAKLDEKTSKIELIEKKISELEEKLKLAITQDELKSLQSQIDVNKNKINNLLFNLDEISNSIANLTEITTRLESTLHTKLTAGNLIKTNQQLMQSYLKGDASIYPLTGTYNVLIIPVEFSDKTLADPNFINTKLQSYIFGDEKNTLSSVYKHASGGKFKVTGEVAPIVKISGKLADYGAPSGPNHDINARGLVKEALQELKKLENDAFWDKFDNWDLNDYDNDRNFHEKDGFLDAVVLVYAGKDEAVCSGFFKEDDLKPTSPRYNDASECVNRIWPHRWSINLAESDPDSPKEGPKVEGTETYAMGLKLSDRVYAYDYNMQSEYSDRSTWNHEFGHSLTLKDYYAKNGDNATGYWDLMSHNSRVEAQELSSLSKMLLGWLEPKIIKYDNNSTSAYLGSYNYYPAQQRDSNFNYSGPKTITQFFEGLNREFDILSKTQSEEPVYRSLLILPPSAQYVEKYMTYPQSWGKKALFSGKNDNANITFSFKIDVPNAEKADFSFETIYGIESETDFLDKNVPNSEIKISSVYDIAWVKIEDKILENLSLYSGDENLNGLAEKNPDCDEEKTLALREKWRTATISDEENAAFQLLIKKCSKPVLITKHYDLSNYKGKNVKIELGYKTDGGVTWQSIFADNFKLNDDNIINFENKSEVSGGFEIVTNGEKQIETSQFYLLEYRDPTENFSHASYNQDQFNTFHQGMFLPQNPGENKTPTERFRLVEANYQPGVLTWYYNTRFGKLDNSPEDEANNGEGYYLVMNAKPREIKLPSELGRPEHFDTNGQYSFDTVDSRKLRSEQSKEFICYSYPSYYKYQSGKDPDCATFPKEYLSAIDNLKYINSDNKEINLKFFGDSSNNYLPYEQATHVAVREPFSGLFSNGWRMGYATFRSPEMGAFKPFKVYKSDASGTMIIDKDLTKTSPELSAISSYSDDKMGADADFRQFPRYKYLSAVAKKVGLKMQFASPDVSVINQYTSNDPNSNFYFARKPRMKIYISKDSE